MIFNTRFDTKLKSDIGKMLFAGRWSLKLKFFVFDQKLKFLNNIDDVVFHW